MLKRKKLEYFLAIARFGFLRYDHMIRLGLGNSSTTCSQNVSKLEKKEYVARIKMKPDVLLCKESGDALKALANNYGKLYSNHKKFTDKKYIDSWDHKEFMIDARIEIEISCQSKGMILEDCFIETAGHIHVQEGLKPDLAFKVSKADRTLTFLVEVENRDTSNANDAEIKINKHIEYLHSKESRVFFNTEYDHQVLYILNDKNLMKKLKSICKEYSWIDDYILFKSKDEFQAGFGDIQAGKHSKFCESWTDHSENIHSIF